MTRSMRLPEDSQDLLCCPICKSQLEFGEEHIRCSRLDCRTQFEIVDGVPVLIHESNSLFSLENCLSASKRLRRGRMARIRERFYAWLPSLTTNAVSSSNYRRMGRLLVAESSRPRVLVIGGQVLGRGMKDLFASGTIEVIELDVSIGPRTAIVGDAHDLCFENESVEAVVIQAVLEHVVDPYRCVAEIHRVLKKDGLVYAETPFIFQRHSGPYDFTRFTHLGHRRLFRQFEELASGVAVGPGSALALSYHYFFMSFVEGRVLQALARVFSILTGFWLKYFDHLLMNRRGAFDAAAGFFFLGRKSDRTLSDRQLLTLFRGLD